MMSFENKVEGSIVTYEEYYSILLKLRTPRKLLGTGV